MKSNLNNNKLIESVAKLFLNFNTSTNQNDSCELGEEIQTEKESLLKKATKGQRMWGLKQQQNLLIRHGRERLVISRTAMR